MKIALIGITGAGKTAVGIKLAEKLNSAFADLDDMIVYRLGMPIDQAFITFNQKTYYGYQTDVLKELVWMDDIVIAFGGGAPLFEESMRLIGDFKKIRLTASPDTIYARIKNDFSRPLLRDNTPAGLKKTIEEREEQYSRYADITVNTDGKTVEEVAEEILLQILDVITQKC